MAGMTLEELQATYPAADHDAYDQARAFALVAGALAELVYACLPAQPTAGRPVSPRRLPRGASGRPAH